MVKRDLFYLIAALFSALSLWGCPGTEREYLYSKGENYRLFLKESLFELKGNYPAKSSGGYPAQRAEQWREFMEKASPLLSKLKSKELSELSRKLARIQSRDRELYGKIPFILRQQIKEFLYRLKVQLNARKREALKAYAEALKAQKRAELALSSGGSVRRSYLKKKPARRIRLFPPLRGSWRVTSRFGWRRDPFTGRAKFHSGIDLPARTGRPVYPAAPGKVVHAGWFGGCGYTVIIKHTFDKRDVRTYYCHLSKILTKKGASVDRNRPIGRVGSSGRSTRPHLHFTLSIDGIRRDPTPYLLRR